MPYITRSQLTELLRPFENVRFAGDARGERPYVDIAAAWCTDSTEARCQYPDCDIRALTGAGVERQWDGKAEIIRWELIRSVTLGRYERDADGWLRYRPREIFHVIQNRQPVQVAA